jgi:hypothetical protein
LAAYMSEKYLHTPQKAESCCHTPDMTTAGKIG